MSCMSRRDTPSRPAFLWTKQNVGGKSRFKVKRKMSTLFFVRSHDLPEVAWRPAVHLRCPAASSRQHVGRTEGTASYPSMAADKSFGSARTRGLVRVRGAVICAHWPWWWGGWGGASCAPGAGAAPHRRRSSTEPLRGADRRGRNRLQLPAVEEIEATFKRWAGQIANQSLPFLNMSYRFDMRKTTNR